jgi:hypothetical protein
MSLAVAADAVPVHCRVTIVNAAYVCAQLVATQLGSITANRNTQSPTSIGA